MENVSRKERFAVPTSQGNNHWQMMVRFFGGQYQMILSLCTYLNPSPGGAGIIVHEL